MISSIAFTFVFFKSLQLAISSFYEEDGDDMDMLPPPVQQSSEPTATQHGSTQAGPPKPTSR